MTAPARLRRTLLRGAGLALVAGVIAALVVGGWLLWTERQVCRYLRVVSGVVDDHPFQQQIFGDPSSLQAELRYLSLTDGFKRTMIWRVLAHRDARDPDSATLARGALVVLVTIS